MPTRRSDVFERALNPLVCKDITDTYLADFGRPEVDDAMLADAVVRETVRALMVKTGLYQIADVAAPDTERAAALLEAGKVAAIDGTDALSELALMNCTTYACAVGWITSQMRGPLRVQTTQTTTKFGNPEDLRSKTTLAALCEQLDAAREDSSWATTFREYWERTVALNCDADLVMIDGPIFTQNLATQDHGRILLGEIARSERIFVGVIKDLRGSWAQSKWCGYSLEKGEGYRVCAVAEPLVQRSRKQSQVGLTNWLDEQKDLGAFSRSVYRPGIKAFGFECRDEHLPLVLAVLLADASPTVGHETPLLLETVDAQLRASFQGAKVRDLHVERLFSSKPDMAIDLTGERTLR